MASRDRITREQWAKLADQLGAHQACLNRLDERLRLRGVPYDDPVAFHLERARDAVQAMRMATHYRSMDGTERPAE